MAKHNMNGFWKYINSKRKDHFLPSIMYYNDESGDDGSSVAELFAQYLKSVYRTSTLHHSNHNYTSNIQDCSYAHYNAHTKKNNNIDYTSYINNKNTMEVSYEEVFNAISNLKTSYHSR